MGSGCLHGALGLLDEPSAPTRSFHQLTLACCAQALVTGANLPEVSTTALSPTAQAGPLTHDVSTQICVETSRASRAWRPCRPGTRCDVVGVSGAQLQPPRGLASTPSSHNARGPTARPQRGAASCKGRLAILIIANTERFGCIIWFQAENN